MLEYYKNREMASLANEKLYMDEIRNEHVKTPEQLTEFKKTRRLHREICNMFSNCKKELANDDDEEWDYLMSILRGWFPYIKVWCYLTMFDWYINPEDRIKIIKRRLDGGGDVQEKEEEEVAKSLSLEDDLNEEYDVLKGSRDRIRLGYYLTYRWKNKAFEDKFEKLDVMCRNIFKRRPFPPFDPLKYYHSFEYIFRRYIFNRIDASSYERNGLKLLRLFQSYELREPKIESVVTLMDKTLNDNIYIVRESILDQNFLTKLIHTLPDDIVRHKDKNGHIKPLKDVPIYGVDAYDVEYYERTHMRHVDHVVPMMRGAKKIVRREGVSERDDMMMMWQYNSEKHKLVELKEEEDENFEECFLVLSYPPILSWKNERHTDDCISRQNKTYMEYQVWWYGKRKVRHNHNMFNYYLYSKESLGVSEKVCTSLINVIRYADPRHMCYEYDN